MSQEGLSLKPQRIGPGDWYYEFRSYLLFVHECRRAADGMYIQTDHFKVPWKMIEASARRKRAKRKVREPVE